MVASSAVSDLALEVDEAASTFAARANDLVNLIAQGRRLGLIEHHCPLCSAQHSDGSFEAGLLEAEAAAKRIDAIAAELAIREQQAAAARLELDRRHQLERVISAQIAANENTVLEFERQAAAISLPSGADLEVIQARSREIHSELETAQRDLRILENHRLNDDFARATQAELSSRLRLQRGQERFGRARRVETTAAALHDAARRAAAETLDLRLERVLPLMAELYARLKPHPIWQDIEYSIRGDVRRFLSLKVGDDLNPQFMFSSGQRRATGLAFLLSINLSLAWSRWRSVLLDDPVQHVDDFRAVHLTEVLSQLVESGRQVICAVEDPALADMMCRRLPIRETGQCCRITLAPTASGTLQVKSATLLKPLPQRAFGAIPHELAG